MDTTSPVPESPEPDVRQPEDHAAATDPDEVLAELAGSDPADAPDLADRLAAELERRLESAS